LALDEGDRLRVVEDYHRRAKLALPNKRLHAAIHVVVENQVALSFEPVIVTLARLQAEGLDRHDAVHAIGLVLVEVMQEQAAAPSGDPNATYALRLAALTAAKFRDA
jgi:hypothetical protein